jgi:hypothetical protein
MHGISRHTRRGRVGQAFQALRRPSLCRFSEHRDDLAVLAPAGDALDLGPNQALDHAGQIVVEP